MSGSVSSPELIRRRTLLGRQRTEVLPACVIEDISLLQPPFASCILREVTGALDLGAYEAVARFSPWPVLVTGTLPSGMIPRLAGIASRTPNLYFLPEPADDELRKKITAMSGLMIYAFKDGVLQSPGLPEIFRQEGTEALPCTIACGISPEMPAGEPHPARVKTFSAAADLVRAARAYLSFPSWPPVRDFRYEREYLAALDVKN